jgi:hypothetical protein
LDKPGIKQEVIRRLAVGETQASIAKDVGVDRSQVCRFASRDEIKPFIEQEQMKLVEVVPDAVENVKELVREIKDIPPKEIKRRELAYKATLDTLKAVGIMPSPVQSLLITNIYQKTNIFQTPLAWEILQKHAKYLAGSKPDGETEGDDAL